ncbi:hypothetical protein [Corallococcus sp. AS-1-6]|uniref:hypothetical protein n=1 Tax=Corallococcus sp. AS-1-6 TaxID=2874599 RepID=UPI001CBB5F35|nr:hypothetical protein [Corallococcus sp. AS-1-6]MBZ4373799.1 hypothetical protein [Corallococcus sp. AS-1-6]
MPLKFISRTNVIKLFPKLGSHPKLFSPQQGGQCYFDHMQVVKLLSDIEKPKLDVYSFGRLETTKLVKHLKEKGPLLLSAEGITLPSSRYTGMHTVALLGVTKSESTQKEVIIIMDRDDTLPRDQDRLCYEIDPEELTHKAAPYTDDETGNSLEMYQVPVKRTPELCTIL